ncbi:hypothetical protein QR680_011697 [Steinernema hermaphroditum]|uniref:Uncharacterized protein n=1 Tax=Steinernema hermaphroditum TaxID=289476 RepID=A0AA39LZG0_9BILA|nr:hypothetical protein QR680_011697 [Steinernema hermaphroditum]
MAEMMRTMMEQLVAPMMQQMQQQQQAAQQQMQEMQQQQQAAQKQQAERQEKFIQRLLSSQASSPPLSQGLPLPQAVAPALPRIVYVIANSVVLPLYVAFLSMFATRTPYKKSTTFRILFWLGVLECFQMVAGIQAGFLTLMNATSQDVFERIGGAFNCMGLFGRPLFLLVLSTKRFFKTAELKLPCTSNQRLFTIGIVINVLLSVWHFIYRLTDMGKAEYSLQFDLFRPPTPIPGTLNAIFRDITVNMDIVAIVLTIIIYCGVLIWGLFKSKSADLKSLEFPAIFQSVVTFAHVLVVKCGSGNIYNFLKNRPMNILFVIWLIVMCISNPLLYLLSVRKLREGFFKFVGFKKDENASKNVEKETKPIQPSKWRSFASRSLKKLNIHIV